MVAQQATAVTQQLKKNFDSHGLPIKLPANNLVAVVSPQTPKKANEKLTI